MILHSLAAYYDRAEGLAPDGWERKRIAFIIEIERDGGFVQLTSLRSGARAADTAPSLVPKAEIRSGTRAFERPNALWDHIGFVLGHAKSDDASDRLAADRQFEAFRKRVFELAARCPDSAGLSAVRRFYERDERIRVFGDPLWPECAAIAGCNATFRLAGEIDTVVLEPAVRAMLDAREGSRDAPLGICLVSGEQRPIRQLHFPIAGVGDKPAPLAAINDSANPAFASFGKQQGLNFPVGAPAVFRYTTALNHLLRPGSRQRLRAGDTTTVFWAERGMDTDVEGWFAEAFGAATDDPDAHTEQVRALYEAIGSGRFAGAHGEHRFHVLGLAPNAARIVVRFWYVAPVAEIGRRIGQWFDDLRIERGPSDPEYPGLPTLLRATAVLGKSDNIAPNLAGDVMRALLDGTPLPASLLQATVQRCRAEQAGRSSNGRQAPNVTFARAALLKACVNRLIRRAQLDGKEIAVALDSDNSEPAYLAGRLFAAYERIQSDAAERDLNRTIRDSYFGTAMSNPAAVFPRLVQLSQHHLRDLRRSKPGLHVVRDRLLADIWNRLPADRPLPLTLPLAERARFALGYYHQRQSFFAKADATPAEEATINEGGN